MVLNTNLILSATSGAATAGVVTLALPANTFDVNNSVITSITSTGVLTAPLYVRSVSLAANTGVATLTLNSSSTAATEVGTFTVCWTTPSNLVK